jgi:ABC-type nitrate/sulfonate/bicarbonate transport system permease component
MAGVADAPIVAAPADVAPPPEHVEVKGFWDRLGLPGHFISLAVLFLAWELVSRSGSFNPYLLPPLSVVLHRVGVDIATGEFFLKIGATLYRLLAGFGIAAVLGVGIGILMTRFRVVKWFFDPVVSVGFPMPKVAFLPIFMLWFGAYDLSKIVLIAFACFFAIAANTIAGTQGVERQLIWSARSLGASEGKILRTVVLPAALPQILTGFQIALPLGMIVTIVAEMLMGGVGLGGSMIHAQRFADSPGVFAGIVEIGLSGFLVIWSVRAIRARLLRWHQEAARR